MPTETEIKLRTSRATLEALREHPLLKKRNKSGWQKHALFNQYFDTPDHALADAKVALHLRRDGEHVEAELAPQQRAHHPHALPCGDAERVGADEPGRDLARGGREQRQAHRGDHERRDDERIAAHRAP